MAWRWCADVELVELKSGYAFAGCGTPVGVSKLYCYVSKILKAFFGHDADNIGRCVYRFVVDHADNAAGDATFPSFDGLMSMGARFKAAKDYGF